MGSVEDGCALLVGGGEYGTGDCFVVCFVVRLLEAERLGGYELFQQGRVYPLHGRKMTERRHVLASWVLFTIKSIVLVLHVEVGQSRSVERFLHTQSSLQPDRYKVSLLFNHTRP